MDCSESVPRYGSAVELASYARPRCDLRTPWTNLKAIALARLDSPPSVGDAVECNRTITRSVKSFRVGANLVPTPFLGGTNRPLRRVPGRRGGHLQLIP